ncbi:MAG TPA: hypothetical protein VJ749_06670 [Pyrinomonadaceae bacterium]|nr:hypothetical protein [Pyrinomonadaceae bacterium]
MRETPNLSCRIYRLLLAAYPSDFRREYGDSMLQVFRDSYRDAAVRQRRLATLDFWLAILRDLVVTASRQHIDNFREVNGAMNNIRRDLIAVIGCAVIILTAFLLLNYGRVHEVGSVLVFGRILDAVVFTGIVGNVIVFLLVKLTSWDSFRIACWTFFVVNTLSALLLAAIASRIDPQFRLAATMLAYVASLVFWVLLHYLWRSTARSVLASS